MRKFLGLLILSIILFGQAGFVLAETASDCTQYCSDPANFDPPPGEFCLCSPIEATSVEALIEDIASWLYWIAIAVAPVMILVGAFMFLTSVGDPTKIERGKKIIIWTVVGLVIILLSRGLISLIKHILGA